ncbi:MULTISPECIES: hypothetical protein [unclassified Helicobacter]|uniref:hypothetical protein n=1 Tax=unclassified Helicobacter TaxID=2593540 RepID=UPI000CF149DC|nr:MULTISPECIES: hypothetical protein [unclassified Helicobacter]
MTPELFFILFCFGGVILIAIITFVLLYRPKQNTKDSKTIATSPEVIISSLKSSYSTQEDLRQNIDLFFKHYHSMSPTNMQKIDFLKAVCLHQNTNAQIILRVQTDLTRLNPNMKNQINQIVEIRAGLL